jgi:transcriptional regulator with XRE-family HTH domain
MHNSQKSIGQAISTRRVAAGYKTQRSFAIEAGLDTSALSRYEAGKSLPPPEQRMRIEDALGLKRGQLLVDVGQMDAKLVSNNPRQEEKLDLILAALIEIKAHLEIK